jgi:hypothetical protein
MTTYTAYTTNTTRPDFPRHGLRRFFTALGDWMVTRMENHPRLKQIERLQALSDEDLAARGLMRSEIVHHVFRDRMY